MNLRIAIDIGGTFTDVVVASGDDVWTTKTPTTPDDLIRGVRDGVQTILRKAGGNPEDVSRFIHGTTVGTNAVIEREGGRLGVLTTAGFRDVLAIGRQKRTVMYDLFADPQTPTFLAPRERRFEIPERLDETGEVLVELDEDEVVAAIDELVEDHGVEAIAVCYLFSFANPAHERRTVEIIEERHPEIDVSRSSVVDPRFREYERLVVTAFDAYLKPTITEYISRMSEALADEDIECDLQVMQSRGGITGADLITEEPVRSILSGPAAAVTGSAKLGDVLGQSDLITFDMGGTSCDIALVEDGQPEVTSDGTIMDYPLRTRMVDVKTIGAGGGSIAWIDDADSLRVGPKSAGADPGPVCYGRGGTDPTVTDASVLLGYLNPEYFAGGTLDLDADSARTAIESEVATPLDYSTVEAAKGIHRIVNAKMAEQVRLHTVDRGIDPRRFSLFAMGGAGPVHVGKIAEDLDVPSVVVPPTPGVLSARGLLLSDVEHDHERTFKASLADAELSAVEDVFEDLRGRGIAAMEKEDVPLDDVAVTYQADMRYVGQSFEVPVTVDREWIEQGRIDHITETFHDAHESTYGHKNLDGTVEFVTLRTVSTYAPAQPTLPAWTAEGSLDAAEKATRETYFPGHDGGMETPIYDRAALPAGVSFDGPAIVEEPNTTTVVYPGHECTVDEHGTLLIDVPN